MELTKRQRYLFRLDTKPTGLVYHHEVLMKVVGIVISLAASSAVGWVYGVVSIPFSGWCGSLMYRVEGNMYKGVGDYFAFLSALVLIVIFIAIVAGMVRLIIELTTAKALCLVPLIISFVAYLATHSYEPGRGFGAALLFVLSLLSAGLFSGLNDNNGPPKIRATAQRELNRIKDQSILMDIVINTHYEEIGIAAIRKMDRSNTTLFVEIAKSTSFRSIRQYACEITGHDWDGCTCRQCGTGCGTGGG